MQQERQRAREWYVEGEVQGVGYRYFVQREAASLGLTGWAANLPDGRVQVYACGPQQRLDDLQRALGEGPRTARVTNLTTAETEPHLANSFEIR